MPPRNVDCEVVRALAARIVAAGAGRVCRVTMIGSRANGTAHAGSDLDLVVLIETPANVPRWSAEQVLSEKRRIMQAVGPPPLKTDLWVRTTDQFEEARGVLGCMEHVMETEGVDVYSRPFTRPPAPRRTSEQVRCQNVRDWLDDALGDLHRASALERGAQVPRAPRPASTHPGHYARRSIQRSIVAVCVWHQAPLPAKQQPVAEAVAALRRVDEKTADAVKAALGVGEPALPAAARCSTRWLNA